MKCIEAEIPVPWGHIAAKIWGNQNDPIVLVVHGFMDNAGSFDRLIPLIPKSFYYVCIDLPGHGKSSHFPSIFPIYSTNNVLTFKLVMQHFKREKYIILGHSWGGRIGVLFTQLYPEYVEKLILLDAVYFFPFPKGQFKQKLRKMFDHCVSLAEKTKTKKRPSYTYAEALQKLQDQRMTEYISREAAEAILPRAVQPVGDGKYSFTVDPRMKFFLNPIHDMPYILDTLKKFPIQCPVLIVLGKASKLHRNYMKPILMALKNCENFRIENVEGTHDVHNNDPEIVAPYITEFLLMQKGKL